MKYLVYPPGYDPLFLPDEVKVDKVTGRRIPHTREEVQRQELLASLAKVVDEEPGDGRWYHPIEE